MSMYDDDPDRALNALLAAYFGPVVTKLDSLKTRLDLIGAAVTSGKAPAEIENAVGLQASLQAMLDELRQEVERGMQAFGVHLAEEIRREFFNRSSSLADRNALRRVEERLARVEMMLTPRRVTPELEARVRAEHAEVPWDDAMRIFERWLVYEKISGGVTVPAPSALIRKFLKEWRRGAFRDGFKTPGLAKADDDATVEADG